MRFIGTVSEMLRAKTVMGNAIVQYIIGPSIIRTVRNI